MIKTIMSLLLFTVLSCNNALAQNAASIPPANLTSVAAIDLDHNGVINLDELTSGHSGIFLLDTKANQKILFVNPMRVENYLVVPSKEALATLDEDQNGFIEPIDSIYKFLYILVIYKDGRHYRILPLNKIGIRAIVVPQGNNAIKNPVPTQPSLEFKAVMANGSSRMIDTYWLDKTLFDDIKTYNLF